ncbi:MAG: 50S ribosomal protein L30 [Bdellovibrionales bacterium GWA2_49_15]|nr:MAG: 50S ribosomal protein L30 [Bdellovibrionales bacterium GWA2_49_15]HAZ12767.1 50S ribosomal protein L30 [Bdellovibrionales bacterium]
MAAKTITVKLKKSTCKAPQHVKSTVLGLGLRKIGQERTLENTPCVRGMIKKVIHLVDFK